MAEHTWSNGAQLDVIVANGFPTRVAVAGEVDASNVGRLERVLSNLSGTIELDCSELDFADASFLGALNVARQNLSARGGSLLVTRPSESVRFLFDLVEFDLGGYPRSSPCPNPRSNAECPDGHADLPCPSRQLGVCD